MALIRKKIALIKKKITFLNVDSDPYPYKIIECPCKWWAETKWPYTPHFFRRAAPALWPSWPSVPRWVGLIVSSPLPTDRHFSASPQCFVIKACCASLDRMPCSNVPAVWRIGRGRVPILASLFACSRRNFRSGTFTASLSPPSVVALQFATVVTTGSESSAFGAPQIEPPRCLIPPNYWRFLIWGKFLPNCVLSKSDSSSCAIAWFFRPSKSAPASCSSQAALRLSAGQMVRFDSFTFHCLRCLVNSITNY